MDDRDGPIESAAMDSNSFPVPDAEFSTAACLGGALALIAGGLRLAISSKAPANEETTRLDWS